MDRDTDRQTCRKKGGLRNITVVKENRLKVN